MTGLFRIDDSLTNKISYYHVMALMLSLPFDFFYCHVILVSFALHTIIHIRKDALGGVFQSKILLLQSVFFVTLIGTIYSAHKSEGMTDVLRQISIFLFPLLFYFNKLNFKKYRSQLLLIFSLACTLIVVYLYADAFCIIRFFKYPMTAIVSKAFINHNFSAPIAMHATFFSLQLGVALVFLLSLIMKKPAKPGMAIYVLCCMILSAGIIQLCSKAVFIALLITINIGFPVFLTKGTLRRRFILISCSLSALCIFGILSAGTFKDRYFTELKTDLSRSTLSDTDDPRINRWTATVELIGKSPIIGYGSGSELPVLREQFYQKKLYNSFLNNLNAHNQYLSFLLVSGIFGLAAYLATLIFGFKTAIANHDIIGLAFMLLIATVSLSESLLNADKGIYFFSFFLSFFGFSNISKTPVTRSETHNYLPDGATIAVLDPSLS